MYDHGKDTIQVNCGRCSLEHIITLNQIANEETKQCECGEFMIFKDEGGGFKKAIKEMNALHNPPEN